MRSRPTARRRTARTMPSVALPVLLHGDAAFAGQGIVAETFNLHGLEGYSTGGTLHLITNNQIGFTTDPNEGRSTRYSSDLAKGFDSPIVHVNADDPEASIAAARLAMAYRRRFAQDVVIDLVGYRRFGHNEQDEAAYTQPLMVEQINAHRSVRELYEEQLIDEGVLTRERGSCARRRGRGRAARRARPSEGVVRRGEAGARRVAGAHGRHRCRHRCRRRQAHLAERGASAHARQSSPCTRSSHASSNGGAARSTTAASTGATRSRSRTHRCSSTESRFGSRARTCSAERSRSGISCCTTPRPARRSRRCSISTTRLRRSRSTTRRSPSTRASASSTATRRPRPRRSSLWEAQYGDFANGAQIVIDQFVSSALSKWRETSRLTLLLPHGYEGNGPEHSSARLERFLQLGAQENIRDRRTARRPRSTSTCFAVRRSTRSPARSSS